MIHWQQSMLTFIRSFVHCNSFLIATSNDSNQFLCPLPIYTHQYIGHHTAWFKSAKKKCTKKIHDQIKNERKNLSSSKANVIKMQTGYYWCGVDIECTSIYTLTRTPINNRMRKIQQEKKRTVCTHHVLCNLKL